MWANGARRGLSIASDRRTNGLLTLLQDNWDGQFFVQTWRGIAREHLWRRGGIRIGTGHVRRCCALSSTRWNLRSFRWWRFRSKLFDPISEILHDRDRSFATGLVETLLEVRGGDLRADGEPPTSNGRVASEEMKTTTTETEVFDDMVQLDGFIRIAPLRLFGDNQIDVHIGVNEIGIDGATHGAANTHQAMLLNREMVSESSSEDRYFRSLEDRARRQGGNGSRMSSVGLHPANILTSSETPLFQTLKTIPSLDIRSPSQHSLLVLGPIHPLNHTRERQKIVVLPLLRRRVSSPRPSSHTGRSECHCFVCIPPTVVRRVSHRIHIPARRGRNCSPEYHNGDTSEENWFSECVHLSDESVRAVWDIPRIDCEDLAEETMERGCSVMSFTSVSNEVLRTLTDVDEVLTVVIVRCLESESMREMDQSWSSHPTSSFSSSSIRDFWSPGWA